LVWPHYKLTRQAEGEALLQLRDRNLSQVERVISTPGTNFGINHGCFNLLSQGSKGRPRHNHTVREASLFPPSQSVIVDEAGKPQLSQYPTQRLVTLLMSSDHRIRQDPLLLFGIAPVRSQTKTPLSKLGFPQ
jgi:hypothetical protein